MQLFENSNSYFTIRFEIDTTTRNFQILKPSPQLRFGNYNGDYGRQEHNKLLPSLAPIDAVFGSYSRQDGSYSQSPFWLTTVAEIVAVLDNYSHRKWQQIVGLRTAKTTRYDSKFQIICHYSI